MKTITILSFALLAGLSTSWALPKVEDHGNFISVTWKDVTEANVNPEKPRADELTFVFRKEGLICIEAAVWPEAPHGSVVANPSSVKLFLKPFGDNSEAPTRKYIALSSKEEKDLVITGIMELSND